MNQRLTEYFNDHIRIATKRLNPTDSRRVNFGVYKFPDGQLQVIFPKDTIDEVSSNVFHVEASCYTPDLMHILDQLIFFLKKKGKTITLKIQYLYGARSDKSESEEFYTCEVAALTLELFDSLAFSPKYLAPHCDVGESRADFTLPEELDLSKYSCIVFPDESARLRYKNSLSGYNLPFVTASKKREQDTGKIISYNVPKLSGDETRVLVIDDLCDYGTTFRLVSEGLGDVEKDLFIHHGVFTENAPSRLLEYYDNIYVSNSLPFPEKYKEQLPTEQQDRLYIFNVWSIEE